MTNKEAVLILRALWAYKEPNYTEKEIREALDLAIDALENVDQLGEDLTKAMELVRKNKPLKGSWQVIGYHMDKYFYCKCSNCQKKTKVFYDKTNPGEFGSLGDIRRNVNFCMFCGADMREGREDET